MRRITFEVQIVADLRDCPEKELIEQTAYVLGVFLESYCANVGRPKIGEIRTLKAGKLIHSTTPEQASRF